MFVPEGVEYKELFRSIPRVRTAAGVAKYGKPIGTPIVGGLALDFITFDPSTFREDDNFIIVKGSESGKEYQLSWWEDAPGRTEWFVQSEDQFDSDDVLGTYTGKTEEEARGKALKAISDFESAYTPGPAAKPKRGKTKKQNDIDALTADERGRYDEAIRLGADHEDAMDAAEELVKPAKPTPNPMAAGTDPDKVREAEALLPGLKPILDTSEVSWAKREAALTGKPMKRPKPVPMGCWNGGNGPGGSGNGDHGCRQPATVTSDAGSARGDRYYCTACGIDRVRKDKGKTNLWIGKSFSRTAPKVPYSRIQEGAPGGGTTPSTPMPDLAAVPDAAPKPPKSLLPASQKNGNAHSKVASLVRVATRAESQADHAQKMLDEGFWDDQPSEKVAEVRAEVVTLRAKADAAIEEMIQIAEGSGDATLMRKAKQARSIQAGRPTSKHDAKLIEADKRGLRAVPDAPKTVKDFEAEYRSLHAALMATPSDVPHPSSVGPRNPSSKYVEASHAFQQLRQAMDVAGFTDRRQALDDELNGQSGTSIAKAAAEAKAKGSLVWKKSPSKKPSAEFSGKPIRDAARKVPEPGRLYKRPGLSRGDVWVGRLSDGTLIACNDHRMMVNLTDNHVILQLNDGITSHRALLRETEDYLHDPRSLADMLGEVIQQTGDEHVEVFPTDGERAAASIHKADAAAKMYGKGSPQHLAAIQKFGKGTIDPGNMEPELARLSSEMYAAHAKVQTAKDKHGDRSDEYANARADYSIAREKYLDYMDSRAKRGAPIANAAPTTRRDLAAEIAQTVPDVNLPSKDDVAKLSRSPLGRNLKQMTEDNGTGIRWKQIDDTSTGETQVAFDRADGSRVIVTNKVENGKNYYTAATVDANGNYRTMIPVTSNWNRVYTAADDRARQKVLPKDAPKSPPKSPAASTPEPVVTSAKPLTEAQVEKMEDLLDDNDEKEWARLFANPTNAALAQRYLDGGHAVDMDEERAVKKALAAAQRSTAPAAPKSKAESPAPSAAPAAKAPPKAPAQSAAPVQGGGLTPDPLSGTTPESVAATHAEANAAAATLRLIDPTGDWEANMVASTRGVVVIERRVGTGDGPNGGNARVRIMKIPGHHPSGSKESWTVAITEYPTGNTAKPANHPSHGLFFTSPAEAYRSVHEWVKKASRPKGLGGNSPAPRPQDIEAVTLADNATEPRPYAVDAALSPADRNRQDVDQWLAWVDSHDTPIPFDDKTVSTAQHPEVRSAMSRYQKAHNVRMRAEEYAANVPTLTTPAATKNEFERRKRAVAEAAREEEAMRKQVYAALWSSTPAGEDSATGELTIGDDVMIGGMLLNVLTRAPLRVDGTTLDDPHWVFRRSATGRPEYYAVGRERRSKRYRIVSGPYDGATHLLPPEDVASPKA